MEPPIRGTRWTAPCYRPPRRADSVLCEVDTKSAHIRRAATRAVDGRLDSAQWTRWSGQGRSRLRGRSGCAPTCPTDLDIFDAHTHLGTDIDGMVGRYEELIGTMDRYGISRAFMFCLDEPDRHPGFQRRQRPDARVRRPLGRPPHPVRAARARRGADRGGANAASTSAPAGSSSIRARRSSCSTTSGSRPCSRSPPSAASRS